MKIQPLVFDFLLQLEHNNSREWFTANRYLYEESLSIISAFTGELIERIGIFDKSVLKATAKRCIFRIYRDIRFSPNKTPYKIHFAMYISKGEKSNKYAGYYLHIQNNNSEIAGGLWSPDKEILSKIRQEIYYDPESYLSIIRKKEFSNTFYELGKEDRLKRPPRGYSSEFEHIELLKQKHYCVGKSLTNEEVLDDNFIDICADTFKKMYLFNHYLNTIIEYENNESNNY